MEKSENLYGVKFIDLPLPYREYIDKYIAAIVAPAILTL